MADSIDNLREEFLAETEDTLADFGRDLNVLTTTDPGGSVPREVVNRAFRTVHSLKGVAGMFGLDSFARVSHALEDALENVRDERVALNEALSELLFRGCDLLRRLRAQAATGRDTSGGDSAAAVDDLESRLRDILEKSLVGDPLPDTVSDPLVAALPFLAAEHRDAIRSDLDAGGSVAVVAIPAGGDDFDARFEQLKTELAAWGVVRGTAAGSADNSEARATVHVVVSGPAGVFQLARIVGSLGCEVLTGDAAAAFSQLREETASTVQAEEPTPEADRAPATRPSLGVGKSLRVPVEKIDGLLSDFADLLQANLHVNRSASAVFDHPGDRMRRTALHQSLRNLDRELRNLQGGILGVRMIRLRPLLQTLEKVFHAACRESAKSGRIVLQGDTVELDRSIVQALTEPLAHLMRNAVDHGLEPPDIRREAGKESDGTVTVRARSEGPYTVIEVGDDGGGIDLNRVLARGRQLGLVPAAGEEPAREAILDLIFHPGLTVRETVGSLSGRGVGLDVVRDTVAALGGRTEVETGPAGTSFRLRIPTTLALAQGLEVRAAGELFILPLAAVVRVIKLGPADVEKRDGGFAARLDGQLITVRDLGEVLGLEPVGMRAEGTPAILIGLADMRVLLLVDGVGRRRDIVMKPLGGLLPELPGISGSTESAEGKTLLVLDSRALVDPRFRVPVQ